MAAGPDRHRCRVCDATDLVLQKRADVLELTPRDFAISDARYGRTGAIYACVVCGFLQCPELGDVAAYYTDLEDTGYEASRDARKLQARRLLRRVRRCLKRHLRGMRLLDIGAGSGPLVEEAAALGLQAEGVEPSAWLRARAAERGLVIHHGVLPHPAVRGEFDLVTLVDVIEHVTEPAALLREAARALRPGGVIVIVTPDLSSWAARLMGWRWWHFRVAHVGYFSRPTLDMLCARAGLQVFARSRPGWVLPLSYLVERINLYLPAALRASPSAWMSRVPLPFNLYDSMMLFARRAPAVTPPYPAAPDPR